MTASYIEWVQARQGYPCEPDIVASRLNAIMERAFEVTWERAGQLGLSLRRGAVVLGIERVAQATRLRGLFP